MCPFRDEGAKNVKENKKTYSLRSQKSTLNHLLTLLTVAVTFPIVINIISVASFLYFSSLRSVIKCYHVTYNVTFVVRGCLSYNA